VIVALTVITSHAFSVITILEVRVAIPAIKRKINGKVYIERSVPIFEASREGRESDFLG
jgi:hypothetical protein